MNPRIGTIKPSEELEQIIDEMWEEVKRLEREGPSCAHEDQRETVGKLQSLLTYLKETGQ